jgi:anti-anti-sigma factor
MSSGGVSVRLGGGLHDVDSRVRYGLQLVVVAAAYTVSGKLGLHLAFANRSVTAIWPPTGIALSALILGGYRLWPAVAVGALVTNLNTGVPVVTVLGIVCGNTLEALTGTFLLRRVADFRPSLQRLRDVVSLVGWGAVISTIVSATIGVASLLLGGKVSWAHLPTVWRTWWLGDMGGDLIVAPAVLIAASYRSYRRLPGGLVEAAALAFLLTGVSVFVFSQTTNVLYCVFPILAWAALRFWQPGAVAGSLVVATVAVVFTFNGKGPFAMSSPDDRLLLAQTFVAVAGVTALVLAAVTRERRRAEEAEREIAETLQRSLLPSAPPSVAGWEIASLYRASGAAEVEVGGDFYDFFATAGGWMMILGDVAGKGVGAAAMAGLVRHGARFVSQLERRPAAVLGRLDHALREQPTLSLCSALCVAFRSDHLVISSAGHPHPIIVRRDGRVREVGGGGPVLGVVSDAVWPERTIRVSPGETVLLYTDGVTDTLGEGERFGQRRVAELLIEHADSPPHELLARLEAALDRFQRGPQSDDTAALALRLERSAVAGPSRWQFAAPRLGSRGRPTARRFQLGTAVRGKTVVLSVVGEIDHATAGSLTDAFEQAIRGLGSDFMLDLAQVTFVDSMGLRSVIEIERRARERALRLRIIAPPEHVRAVFRLSGVERLLPSAGRAVGRADELDYSDWMGIELPVSDRAPGLARSEVREAVAGKLGAADSEIAVLLTSELVTNAVVHPEHRDGGTIGLRVASGDGRLRVQVADSGQGFDPSRLAPPGDAPGGRGLVAVERAAARWGTSQDHRFCVWFELGGGSDGEATLPSPARDSTRESDLTAATRGLGTR